MSVNPVSPISQTESYKTAAVPRSAVNVNKNQNAVPVDKVTLSPISKAPQQARSVDADHDGDSK